MIFKNWRKPWKKNILPLHKLHLLTIEKFKVIRTISRPIVNELFNRTKGNNYNLRNPCLWITTTTSASMLLTSQAGAGSFCFNLGVFRNLLDTPALIEITLNQFFHSFRDIHGPFLFFFSHKFPVPQLHVFVNKHKQLRINISLMSLSLIYQQPPFL